MNIKHDTVEFGGNCTITKEFILGRNFRFCPKLMQSRFLTSTVIKCET